MNRFVKYGAFFLAGFMSAGAMGMEVLFDFENTTGGWKATQWRAKVEFSDALPVDGRRGLVFTHPRWRPEEQNNQQTWSHLHSATSHLLQKIPFYTFNRKCSVFLSYYYNI